MNVGTHTNTMSNGKAQVYCGLILKNSNSDTLFKDVHSTIGIHRQKFLTRCGKERTYCGLKIVEDGSLLTGIVFLSY